MGGRHKLNCGNRAHNQIWRDKKAEFFHHFQPDKNKICFTSLALWTLERVAPVVAPSKIWRDKSQTSHRPEGSEWSSDYDRQWLAVTGTWPSESSWKRTPENWLYFRRRAYVYPPLHTMTALVNHWQRQTQHPAEVHLKETQTRLDLLSTTRGWNRIMQPLNQFCTVLFMPVVRSLWNAN